ncbi:MAG: hypothetical protein ACK5PP_13060 [Acidimicrobiales bacterium]
MTGGLLRFGPFARDVRVELIKLVTLPSGWLALVLSAGVGALISAAASVSLRDVEPGLTEPEVDGLRLDIGFGALSVATVGAIAVGVVAVSAEYRVDRSLDDARPQITASLTACPRRGRLVAAKFAAVWILSTAAWVVATGPGLFISHRILAGDLPAGWFTASRALGSWLYFELTATLAFGLTLLSRRGVVPLLVLVANTTVVSIGQLLSHITPLGRYFPDAAGRALFARDPLSDPPLLHPVVGGLIMAVWAVVAVAAGTASFLGRDQ